MKKEILLYGPMYDWTAEDLIKEFEANKSSEIVLRVNSPGGSVYSSYGIYAKIAEHTKKVVLQVDGVAASAAAIMLCYANEAECYDVSEFMFHRAAFPWWVENDKKLFTDELKAQLNAMNANLRAAMEGKFTADKWEEVTGVSLDELFSLDSRIDVWLNASQAKELGIVNKVKKLTPDKKAEFDSLAFQAAAMADGRKPAITTNPIFNKNPEKKMTLDELKAQHPDVFAAAAKEGIKQERDRVGAYMAFIGVDAKAVAEGIKSGEPLSQTAMAEFTLKAVTNKVTTEVEAGNAPAVQTPEATDAPEATEDEKRISEFRANIEKLRKGDGQ